MELLLFLGLLLFLAVGKWRLPRVFGDALADTLLPGANLPKSDKDARIPWPETWGEIEERVATVIVAAPTPIPPTPRLVPWGQLPPYKPELVQLPTVVTSQPLPPPKKVVAPPPPAPVVQKKTVAPPPPITRPGKLPPITRSPLRGRGYATMPRHKTVH